MPRIEWDNSFSVLNTEIDDQHKEWIRIFNKMHEILTGDNTEAKYTAAEDSIKAMLDYAREHFKFEEEYMRNIDYPELVQHHRKHKDFDTQVYELFRDIQNGGVVLNTEIISMVKGWLLNHILVEDKKYALFFENKSSI